MRRSQCCTRHVAAPCRHLLQFNNALRAHPSPCSPTFAQVNGYILSVVRDAACDLVKYPVRCTLYCLIRSFHGLSGRMLAATAPEADSTMCSAMYDELKGAAKSEALSALVAVAVSRAVALLCHRSAALAAPVSTIRSISSAAGSAQLTNIALCSQLYEVHRSLLLLLPKLSQAPAEACLHLLFAAMPPFPDPAFC